MRHVSRINSTKLFCSLQNQPAKGGPGGTPLKEKSKFLTASLPTLKVHSSFLFFLERIAKSKALSGRCLSPGYSTEIARDAKDDFSDIIFDKDKDKDRYRDRDKDKPKDKYTDL